MPPLISPEDIGRLLSSARPTPQDESQTMVSVTPADPRRRRARVPSLASLRAFQLLQLFPGLVAPNPEEREDMDFLSTIVGHLAEVNTAS